MLSAGLRRLQRQIAHATSDLGRPKTESAAESLRAINPDVHVVCHQQRLNGENAFELLDGYDFVIDGTDNFPSKFLIADACHLANKPYSHAGILQFYGQTITVIPGETTCYRCVFPAPPPPGTVPSCSQAGVLGAVAGVMGTIQAVETVKCLLGVGELVTGRLLTFDALAMQFRSVKIKRNPRCPLCGEHPTITELIDTGTATGGSAACRISAGGADA